MSQTKSEILKLNLKGSGIMAEVKRKVEIEEF